MAATDQTYRNQRTLDIVFGVSCVLMLVSIIAMFAQDYGRSFKVEQRLFRDVEEAMAERAALRMLPDAEEIQQAESAVAEARRAVDDSSELKAAKDTIKKLTPKEAYALTKYQSIKADFDSFVSLYNIAVEEHGPDRSPATQMRTKVKDKESQLNAAKLEHEQIKSDLDAAVVTKNAIEKPLTDALDRLKKLNTEFDRSAKTATQKRWGLGDAFRNLPVLDAFAPPTKIQQITLDELPIDYAFKYVTRYDRCTTCHLGIDRPTYTREALRDLDKAPEDLADKLKRAKELITQRKKLLQGTNESLDLDESGLRLATVKLGKNDAEAASRVNEFCAHPRLDLFVGDNSPHPREKFGCSICHGGQGSATEFYLASHMPNDAATMKRWKDEQGWENNHYWDFPMLPQRFVESGCLKCHHQVTDLIRDGSRAEAPKLVDGYHLIEKAGCFGCHEIAGTKLINQVPRRVGPDLRLEPSPPLESLAPAERAKALADAANPPGTMRKVGPSLYRISEKTNEDWARKWVKAPRGFRPSTWMPHFYGLSNNNKEALAGTGQEAFPDAEIHAIVHFLFRESENYVKGGDRVRQYNLTRQKELAEIKERSDKEQKELDDVTRRLELTGVPTPLEQLVRDLPAEPGDDKGRAEQLTRGRQLFSERGCLACHVHKGTEAPAPGAPAVVGQAHFGPDLSRLAAKLGKTPGDRLSARRWLVQWVMNPTVHHPRSFMPVTHLTVEQASDVAAWLLSQPADWNNPPEVEEPKTETLKELATVYLSRSRTKREVEEILTNGIAPEIGKDIKADSPERELVGPMDNSKLKMYIGRKAVAQLGCYGCHQIPGFDDAKPIGTPLNDWGKKDPERLAFEDIKAYLKAEYHEVESLTNEQGQPVGFKEGKAPYETFFAEALGHHHDSFGRVGFLHQKLREPRSYDYHRMRVWDERLRMPQFKFARTDRKANESDDDYAARSEKDEAEAREAVMTFVLGLVAEQVPAKYVHNPAPDRLAEVRGRQVLDKFNCAGCHQVRAGVFDFKKTPETLKQLEEFHATAKGAAAADHSFDHNAWLGAPQPQADRYTARGFPDATNDDPKMLVLRLAEALRFTGSDKQPKDIPASASIGIATDDLLSRSDPYGGTLAELLVPYLAQRDPQLYKEAKNARAALPPPLIREGEKVQPAWLFGFLKNPFAVRPMTVLRMPRFNLSDEEAQALVNYFASVDKTNNPREGLTYPYLAVQQRDEDFFKAKSAEYVARLKQKGKYEERVKQMQPFWDRQLQERTTDLEGQVKLAEATANAVKDDAAKKEMATTLGVLRKELERVKGDAGKKEFIEAQRKRWEEQEAYAVDAYRLTANYAICLNCHQVGNVPPKQAQGPDLNITAERLRPEWTLRWIASPDRLITYPTPMPQNFPADKMPWPEFVTAADGRAGMLEQMRAVRDILMILPKVADLPANRHYRPPVASEGAK